MKLWDIIWCLGWRAKRIFKQVTDKTGLVEREHVTQVVDDAGEWELRNQFIQLVQGANMAFKAWGCGGSTNRRLSSGGPADSTDLAFDAAKRIEFDAQADEAYFQKARDDAKRLKDHYSPTSRGYSTNLSVLNFMSKCHPPTVDETLGPVELLLFSAEGARAYIRNNTLKHMLLVNCEAPYPWESNVPPIPQFLSMLNGRQDTVAVPLTSISTTEPSFVSKSIGQIIGRFLNPKVSPTDPWNVLDIRNPLQSSLPSFMQNPNCTLLHEMQQRQLGHGSAEEYGHWNQLASWALLSEGGHNTSSHTDSHGMETWITAIQGGFGIGWCTNSKEVLTEWPRTQASSRVANGQGCM